MHSFLKTVVTVLATGSAAVCLLAQQTVLHASAGHPDQARSVSPGYALSTEVYADLTVSLTEAAAKAEGSLWLEVSASIPGEPASVTLRIPLSSTEEAYGESRSCKEGPGGGYEPSFTAGLDEKNFIDFQPTQTPRRFHLLLNKYLCRALAAPFDCFGHPIKLPRAWNGWRVAKVSFVTLTSGASSKATVSPVTIVPTSQPFDYGRCAIVAPSNGMCCVQHKATEWHCGGTPAGAGWHQVSGDCFHRETGTSCTE